MEFEKQTKKEILEKLISEFSSSLVNDDEGFEKSFNREKLIDFLPHLNFDLSVRILQNYNIRRDKGFMEIYRPMLVDAAMIETALYESDIPISCAHDSLPKHEVAENKLMKLYQEIHTYKNPDETLNKSVGKTLVNLANSNLELASLRNKICRFNDYETFGHYVKKAEKKELEKLSKINNTEKLIDYYTKITSLKNAEFNSDSKILIITQPIITEVKKKLLQRNSYEKGGYFARLHNRAKVLKDTEFVSEINEAARKSLSITERIKYKFRKG